MYDSEERYTVMALGADVVISRPVREGVSKGEEDGPRPPPKRA
jgi:hypothetical protein